MKSPYAGKPASGWSNITKRLIRKHPLSEDEIAEVVLESWKSIFASRMGTKGFRIGRDMFPKPQIMGFFLHELIPLELAARHPQEWRVEETAGDKDIVYVPDSAYSIEIRRRRTATAFLATGAMPNNSSQGKKAKSGYYLAINFEKFTKTNSSPKIRLIRFGWLDSDDWVGQTAATGQQSRLSTDVETKKLLQLYAKS